MQLTAEVDQPYVRYMDRIGGLVPLPGRVLSKDAAAQLVTSQVRR